MIRQSNGDGFIEDYVNELLCVIEEDIKLAIDNKRNFSRTEVPTNFNVPSMPNWRAQKHIYFHTLRALKSAQYFPTILIQGAKSESQQVFIYVKWFSKEDEEMEMYMDKYIKMHSMDPEVLEIPKNQGAGKSKKKTNS